MYTDHELISMTQQYTTTHQGEYITHLAYEEINRQASKGRAWAKCMDCGNPFAVVNSREFCSSICEELYMNYMMREGF